MRALQFNFGPVRYAATKVLGSVYSRAFTSKIGCVAYGRVPEPVLPGADWVKVDTLLGGICGSDLSLVSLQDSPSLSPFASFPFVIGHENVGVIREGGAGTTDFPPGQRVVVDPLLPCAVRGFAEPCAACRAGWPNRCARFTTGDLAPGLLLGNCRDTGGSWGETFVAHRKQVIPVPDAVSDENAVLAEPFGCALHAVDVVPPPAEGTALVIGGGVIGLATVAALRLVAPRCRIVVLARYDFQRRAARRLGADEVLIARGRELYEAVARTLDTKLLRPVLGAPVLVGGADVVYECAGSDGALDEALRFAAPGGRVVLLGLAAIPRGIDWSFVWRKELHVQGVFAAGPVTTSAGNVSAVQKAIDLFTEGTVDLSFLVTHRFALDDYRAALDAATGKARSRCLKAVFVPAANRTALREAAAGYDPVG